MNEHRNRLYLALKTALAGGVAAGLSITAAPAVAQDEAAELDRVQVTGSRITRTDIEGALPVTIIDREQIELSGATNTADLLRDITMNSFGSFRPQSGNAAQASALLSLRGLGSTRTLILVDGRRLPKGPNVSGVVNDLNTIPLAAVERMEILSDGASAIYGSDAIGGVVNIITRKDFDGVQLRYGWSDPKRDGGKTREGSAIFGTTGDRGRILAGVSKNSRSILYAADRPWSQSQLGPTYEGSQNLSDIGNTFLRFVDADGNFVAPTDPSAVNIIPEAAPGCEDISPLFHVLDDNLPSATFATLPGTVCAYDFTPISADEASVGNLALFVNADFEINNDWRLYAQTGVTRIESFGRYAPAPALAQVLPAGSPNNPYDEDVWLLHRYAALGPRITTTDSSVYQGILGVEGRVGMVDLDFGVNYAENKYQETGENYVVTTLANAAIASGAYNVLDPFDNDPTILNGIKATIGRQSQFKAEEYYGTASMDLFNLPAGPVVGLIGGEWRRETYVDQYDSLSEAGAIGGSAGNSAGGSRTAKAAYFEVLFPLLYNLELSVAGRYDDYSDYGSDFSPKIALRYQPLDQLTLRASYGQGFAAPSLDIITQQPSVGNPNTTDLVLCQDQGIAPGSCPSVQRAATTIANPELESENSKQWSLGVAFEPLNWLNGSLDYYNITVEDSILFFGAQTLINRELAGLDAPPGLGIVRNPPPPGGTVGTIQAITTGYANEGEIETDGFDLNLRTNFNFGDAGRLSNQLQIGYVRSFTIDDGRNLVGDNGNPKFRGQLNNMYAWGDFRFAWNINWIDSTALTVVQGERQGKLGSWVIHSAQASWFAPWNAEITVGVTNILDRDPPLNPAELRNFDFNLYNQYGRVPYIRYTQTF